MEAAEALRLTAADALELGVATAVVPEPPGGAHLDPAGAAGLLRDALVQTFTRLHGTPADELMARRYQRFRHIGDPR
jgi:acetyl-CoA carboxylase carboxyl transferase subunit beta